MFYSVTAPSFMSMIRPRREMGLFLPAVERHGMGNAIESTPTFMMRTELATAGVEVPSSVEELTELSTKLNTWLETQRSDEGLAHSTTWFNLFATVDVDGSGYITYDELCDVIRHKLRKGTKVMSDDAIKALWCALDNDNSNSVQKDEMVRATAATLPPRTFTYDPSTAVTLVMGPSCALPSLTFCHSGPRMRCRPASSASARPAARPRPRCSASTRRRI